MSSLRSRKGGTRTRRTSSLKNRSSRKSSLLDQGREILVRGRDTADIDRTGRLRADRADLARLKHAQELTLQRGRQIADLIEKDRPSCRLDEQPPAGGRRAGERARARARTARSRAAAREAPRS